MTARERLQKIAIEMLRRAALSAAAAEACVVMSSGASEELAAGVLAEWTRVGVLGPDGELAPTGGGAPALVNSIGGRG